MLTGIVVTVIFVVGAIVGGNHALRSAVDHVLASTSSFDSSSSSSEHFSNKARKNNDIELVKMDECKKMDEQAQKRLNFQTGTNIPLSPHSYKNYVGNTHIYKNKNDYVSCKSDTFYLPKNKLLYDGIWESKNENENPYLYESWKLVNKPVPYDYYTSQKMFQVNKKIPKNFIDKSAVTKSTQNSKYYTYINDNMDDVCDKEIVCFENVFNKGIYPKK